MSKELGKLGNNFQEIARLFMENEGLTPHTMAKAMRNDLEHGYEKTTSETIKRNIFETQPPNALTMDRIIKFIESRGYEVTEMELKKK